MTSSFETFAQLELPPALLQALAEVGYESPSPIQAACIPHLMAGSDLLGQAQTGTGKTAAFALPLLARLDLTRRVPQALVLAPTRELAIQVAEALQSYARHLPGFHVLPVYGGQGMALQLRQLERGVHVIVGTPGRIIDHLERQTLKLDALRLLVLDEADEMLRMGFIDDVESILQRTPASRQTALFSATMPDAIRRVAQRYLRSPQEVKIRSSTSTVAATEQRYWQVAGLHKLDALTRILEVEDDFEAAIIFVRTKTETVVLAEKLEARGYAAAALNGDMTQPLRERAIESLRKGQLDIVVATDVAARGLDVPRISHVINYDIPYDTEAYVHRIGRTGRAGRAGKAILFVASREMHMLRAIERATRQPIRPLTLPTREAVADRRVAQFQQQVVDALANEDLEFFRGVVARIKQERNLGVGEIAAALAFLAQRERPLRLDGEAPKAAERRPANSDVAPAARQRAAAPVDGVGESVALTPAAERPAPSRPVADAAAPRRREAAPAGGWTLYRVAVGKRHEATPANIVGAIANEAGIDSQYIGRIVLDEEFSTVELPPGMPDEVLRVLKKARVRGRPLDIAAVAAAPARAASDDATAGRQPPKKRRP